MSDLGKRFRFLLLDIISIPGFFMPKKYNAIYHLKVICSLCPDYRRKLRDVKKNGKCWWAELWGKKFYEIPRHFGAKNFINQYLFLRTDLSRFRKISKKRK